MPEKMKDFIADLRLSIDRWKRDAIHFEEAGAFALSSQIQEWAREAEEVRRLLPAACVSLASRIIELKYPRAVRAQPAKSTRGG